MYKINQPHLEDFTCTKFLISTEEREFFIQKEKGFVYQYYSCTSQIKRSCFYLEGECHAFEEQYYVRDRKGLISVTLETVSSTAYSGNNKFACAVQVRVQPLTHSKAALSQHQLLLSHNIVLPFLHTSRI